MVEKMKLLHITGPKNDIDRVMEQYLSRYEIHFENAASGFGISGHVRPFAETNICLLYTSDAADERIV